VTVAEFEAASRDNFSGVLLALWWDGKGDWEQAHVIAQDISGRDGAWVHAYLHRKEGDSFNANYWYRQAGRRPASGDLRVEWEAMVSELLISAR
jgi:hypothetical protein